MIQALFRALKDDISNCNWVYGNLIYTNDVPRITDDGCLLQTCLKGTEGQCSFIKDKNGIDVYYGDIIKCYLDGTEIGNKDVVEFNNGCFCFRYRNTPIINFIEHDGLYDTQIEVIGNIFENKFNIIKKSQPIKANVGHLYKPVEKVQEKKDYEIVERECYGNVFNIIKVRRLLDGEVFGIKDKYSNNTGGIYSEGLIKSFELFANEIRVYTIGQNGFYYLRNIQKVKQPLPVLFTETEFIKLKRDNKALKSINNQLCEHIDFLNKKIKELTK